MKMDSEDEYEPDPVSHFILVCLRCHLLLGLPLGLLFSQVATGLLFSRVATGLPFPRVATGLPLGCHWVAAGLPLGLPCSHSWVATWVAVPSFMVSK